MESYIFGIRTVLEAIRAGKSIDKILIYSKLKGELSGELFKELRDKKIFTQNVPIEKINNITNKNHQGVIAYISPIEYSDIELIINKCKEKDKVPLILILDGITDVRNFGAIARSCECCGVDAIIIPKHGSVRVTEDAIKTSAGALFNIPVCLADNLTDIVLLLKQYEIQIISTNENSDKNIYDINFKIATAIILGSEDSGISKQLLKQSDYCVKIPMLGKTESLNVSVSAGICIYEAIRQRIKYTTKTTNNI